MNYNSSQFISSSYVYFTYCSSSLHQFFSFLVLPKQNRKMWSKMSIQIVIDWPFCITQLDHFFIIYLINKIINLHISLLVICVSSSFTILINNCQASTLQGQLQGPQLKCWGPVPLCPTPLSIEVSNVYWNYSENHWLPIFSLHT